MFFLLPDNFLDSVSMKKWSDWRNMSTPPPPPPHTHMTQKFSERDVRRARADILKIVHTHFRFEGTSSKDTFACGILANCVLFV